MYHGVLSEPDASPAAQAPREQLADERTLTALNHLLSRLEVLDQATRQLSALMERAPGLMAIAGDVLDETYRDATARGIDLEERLQTALALAEKLTEPRRAEQLEQLLHLADRLPGMVAMTADVFDEQMHQAVDQGLEGTPRARSSRATVAWSWPNSITIRSRKKASRSISRASATACMR